MSTLLEFAMFPTDKGESVSPFVGRIINYIDKLNVSYQLTAMGTIIETETMEEALGIVNQCYKQLEPDCNRVYTTVTLDTRKDHTDCRTAKVEHALKHVDSKK